MGETKYDGGSASLLEEMARVRYDHLQRRLKEIPTQIEVLQKEKSAAQSEVSRLRDAFSFFDQVAE